MNSLILFSIPAKAYENMAWFIVGDSYTQMAIEDFDSFIRFSEKYNPFSLTPDFKSLIGKKEGLNIFLTLFANQEVERVGDLEQNLISSSYLFNPKSFFENLYFPDMDVVEMKGTSNVKPAIESVKKFYEKYGWKTYVFDGTISETIEVNANPERFSQPIKIYKPEALREIAREELGYDVDKLYFK